MKVVLNMERGPGAVRRFEVQQHVYRAIGRDCEDGSVRTVILEDQAELEREEQAKMEAHLVRVAEGQDTRRPASQRPQEGAFRRGSDILLDDSQISRTHAMVFVDHVGASVVDLGSTNGTYVNAQQVTDSELFDGDMIRFGKVRFSVSVQPG